MDDVNGSSHSISWYRPLLCSTIAGLATGLGGFLVLWGDVSTNSPHLALSLGLSAGVMLTISIFDLFIPAIFRSSTTIDALFGFLACACGIIMEICISKCLPEDPGFNLVDVLPIEKGNRTNLTRQRRFRLGILLAITLALHNFPEGLAVAASNMQSESLGFLMTVAIAVHNVPEGLCVAMPIYASTQSLSQAVKLAALSGLTEPLGALVALVFMGDSAADGRWVDLLLCFVAGVMVSVSFRELIPEAVASGHVWPMRQGMLAGTIFMALTMWIV